MITDQDYKGLTALAEKRYTKYYDWIRHLILISAGLIGILVSLKSNTSNNTCETIAFITSICSLGIGILTGSVSLYGEIDSLDKARKLYANRLIEIMKGKTYDVPFDTIDKRPIYRIMELICFISLFIAMISLITYGVFKA
jgi:hypothetical protein